MDLTTLVTGLPYVGAYVGDFLVVLVSLHAVALVIVNLTPTPEDDKWVGIVYSYIEKLAGIIKPSHVKSLPGEGPAPV